jgi:hypothetical protein
MLDAENAMSLAAMARLAEAGKVRAYPVGTRVKVVGSSIFSRKVIVTDGEDAGDMGWVQNEQVLPDTTPPTTQTENPAPKIEPAPSTPEEKTREERQRLIDKRRAKRSAQGKSAP